MRVAENPDGPMRVAGESRDRAAGIQPGRPPALAYTEELRRRHMEAVILQSPRGQPVKRRRADRAAEGTRVCRSPHHDRLVVHVLIPPVVVWPPSRLSASLFANTWACPRKSGLRLVGGIRSEARITIVWSFMYSSLPSWCGRRRGCPPACSRTPGPARGNPV